MRASRSLKIGSTIISFIPRGNKRRAFLPARRRRSKVRRASCRDRGQTRDRREKTRRRQSARWKATLARARQAIAAYQFSEAVATLQKVNLTATSLQAERDDAVQRAQWIADWKTKLIEDINGTGFVRYNGPMRRATATEMELKTRYGRVMSKWLNFSPKMLTMSIAFIRPGVSNIRAAIAECDLRVAGRTD
jgi:hypothetical protein